MFPVSPSAPLFGSGLISLVACARAMETNNKTNIPGRKKKKVRRGSNLTTRTHRFPMFKFRNSFLGGQLNPGAFASGGATHSAERLTAHKLSVGWRRLSMAKTHLLLIKCKILHK